MKSSTETATTGTAERPRGRFAPTPSGPLHLGSLLAAASTEPGLEPVHSCTCRDATDRRPGPHAIRLRIEPQQARVLFSDAWQGRIEQDCRSEAGDFVIRRRDAIFAYHLAVVVDDELQGINRIIRGVDLLASTPRQILLQRALGYRTPAYAHLPLLVEPDGCKLAKSRHALPLDLARASGLLCEVLAWLRQDPPAGLARAPLREGLGLGFRPLGAVTARGLP